MSCETVTGSIVALLDGELAEAERREVELHLAACTACARELREVQVTRDLVSRHLSAAGARVGRPRFADLWERVGAGPDSDAGSAPRSGSRPGASRPGSVSRPARSGRRWLWAGASAGVALAAGVALLVLAPRLVDLAPVPHQADGAKAPAAASAPQAVAAKPAQGSAPRVAKNAAKGAAPAKEQLARRAEPKAAPEESTAGAETPAEEAVAVNELDPPRELLERPDLFLNYPIVRKLEELRHLDSVLADHGADDLPDDGGAG